MFTAASLTHNLLLHYLFSIAASPTFFAAFSICYCCIPYSLLLYYLFLLLHPPQFIGAFFAPHDLLLSDIPPGMILLIKFLFFAADSQ